MLSIKFHASKYCMQAWSRSWIIAQQLRIRNTITEIYVYINYSMNINFSGLQYFMYYVDCWTLLFVSYTETQKAISITDAKNWVQGLSFSQKKTCRSTGVCSTFNLFLLCTIKESYCLWWKVQHIYGWWHLALSKWVSCNILQ